MACSYAHHGVCVACGRQAILGPGDVLFVPPLWVHHVTSLTCSAGVNVFSASSEASAVDAMLRVPLPFESDWSLARTHASLHLFVATVLEMAGACRALVACVPRASAAV